MNQSDVRWKQRLNNYRSALARLNEAMALMRQRELSVLEKQGVIQSFEFTYELACNLLRDFLRWQGIASMAGSRDTLREAFSAGLVEDGEGWMDMLQDRNLTSHTYNEALAEAFLTRIRSRYHQLLLTLEKAMSERAERDG